MTSYNLLDLLNLKFLNSDTNHEISFPSHRTSFQERESREGHKDVHHKIEATKNWH